MANLVRFAYPLWDLESFFIFDDFWQDQSDINWIDTVTDTGTVTMGDWENGQVELDPSDATVADNDEAYMGSASENFLVASNRSLYFRTRISYQEQNTDDANIAVGFANAVAANLIVDDGAGIRTTGNWFSIFKVDGETLWRCGCRNGTATSNTQSTTTAGVANDQTNWQTLEIHVHDFDGGTNVQVTYAVDGLLLRDTNNLVIKHTSLIASATEMQAFLGVKNGGANNELLYSDYVFAGQTR